MSYSISTDIFCDICKTNWVHGVVSGKAEKLSALAVAQSKGWVWRWDSTLKKHQHVCPLCRAGQ